MELITAYIQNLTGYQKVRAKNILKENFVEIQEMFSQFEQGIYRPNAANIFKPEMEKIKRSKPQLVRVSCIECRREITVSTVKQHLRIHEKSRI